MAGTGPPNPHKISVLVFFADDIRYNPRAPDYGMKSWLGLNG